MSPRKEEKEDRELRTGDREQVGRIAAESWGFLDL